MKSPQKKISFTPRTEKETRIFISTSCDFTKLNGLQPLGNTISFSNLRRAEKNSSPPMNNSVTRTPKETPINTASRRASNVSNIFTSSPSSVFSKENPTGNNAALEKCLSPPQGGINNSIRFPQIPSLTIHDSLGNKSSSIRGELRANGIRKRMMEFENAQILFGKRKLEETLSLKAV